MISHSNQGFQTEHKDSNPPNVHLMKLVLMKSQPYPIKFIAIILKNYSTGTNLHSSWYHFVPAGSQVHSQ